MSKVKEMVIEINELLDDMNNTVDDVVRISGAPRVWVEDIIVERFEATCKRSEERNRNNRNVLTYDDIFI
jgi:hypothetical protein